jgi:aspartyl-tRNA(Asn)/glutamyl-tRNA(Gln) amidotransferase subunit B
LPELPDAKRKRYEALGITPYNASVLTAEVETARWFDALLEAGAEPVAASNWANSSMLGVLNSRNLAITDPRNAPQANAAILTAVSNGTISRSQAPAVFEYVLDTGDHPDKIIVEKGLKQTSDTGAIDAEIDKVLAANSDKVAEYKAGKEQLFGFFVGQTMKAMAGKGNPKLVNERLRAKLG